MSSVARSRACPFSVVAMSFGFPAGNLLQKVGAGTGGWAEEETEAEMQMSLGVLVVGGDRGNASTGNGFFVDGENLLSRRGMGGGV